MDEAVRRRIGFVSSFMLAAAKEKISSVFPLAAGVPTPSIGFVSSNSRQGFSPEIPPRIGPSTLVSSTLHWGCTPFSCDSTVARLVGLDYFGARYFSSAQGRFVLPDPSPMGVALGDPQSWNLYAYVRNRPTRSVDKNGNWATDVHAQIVTYSLQGYLSAGELQELVNRQYAMDTDQSDQHRHFMQNATGDSAAAATNAAWSFVSMQMGIAQQSVLPNGIMQTDGLRALGNLIHTVEDYTSPMHTDSNFMPQVWNGGWWPPSGWGPGLAHVDGEASPSQDWARIGLAVRLTMAALLQSKKGCESGRRCLTEANFESEFQSNITYYINHFYDRPSRSPNPGFTAIQEDMARQCALGNPAACEH